MTNSHSLSASVKAPPCELDLAILFSRDAVAEPPSQPLVDEEFFVMLPASSKLVPKKRVRIAVAETAERPLIQTTSIHGLRRHVAEFEQRNLTPNEPVQSRLRA